MKSKLTPVNSFLDVLKNKIKLTTFELRKFNVALFSYFPIEIANVHSCKNLEIMYQYDSSLLKLACLGHQAIS